jgi:hypothetical protein
MEHIVQAFIESVYGIIVAMLLWLADYLAQYYKGFHVFNYLTLTCHVKRFNCLSDCDMVWPYGD